MFTPKKHYSTAPAYGTPHTEIPEDEPYFTLRAKDYCAISALAQYLDYCGECGVSKDHLDGIKEALHDFDRWQRGHKDKVRLPD